MHNPTDTSAPDLQVNHSPGPNTRIPSKVWSLILNTKSIVGAVVGSVLTVATQALLLGDPSFNNVEVWERVENHWTSVETEESYKESYNNFFSKEYIALHEGDAMEGSYSYWNSMKQIKYTAKQVHPEYSHVYLVTQHQYSKNPTTKKISQKQRYSLDCLSWIAKLPLRDCPKSDIRVDTIVKP